MLNATKVRIYPTPEQEAFLNAQFGAVRFVYNKALHIISTQYKRHGTKLRAKKDLKPLLAVAKKSRKYHWLKDYDSIALQQACINLDRAFQNFFDPKLPARYPRFKRKQGKQSSYHCTSIKVGEGDIKIPQSHAHQGTNPSKDHGHAEKYHLNPYHHWQIFCLVAD